MLALILLGFGAYLLVRQGAKKPSGEKAGDLPPIVELRDGVVWFTEAMREDMLAMLEGQGAMLMSFPVPGVETGAAELYRLTQPQPDSITARELVDEAESSGLVTAATIPTPERELFVVLARPEVIGQVGRPDGQFAILTAWPGAQSGA